jgi:Transposase IS66 family
MILRFATDLSVAFTNNEAERSCRPVKIQQRTSGGAWRTLQGLTDFAIVQSYLDTATKWGLDKLEVLRELFTTGAWQPPALTPADAMKGRGLRSLWVPSKTRVLTFYDKGGPCEEGYAGKQIVGIDLHRRRSVLVRMSEDGQKLETSRISNDPEYLRAGDGPCR